MSLSARFRKVHAALIVCECKRRVVRVCKSVSAECGGAQEVVVVVVERKMGGSDSRRAVPAHMAVQWLRRLDRGGLVLALALPLWPLATSFRSQLALSIPLLGHVHSSNSPYPHETLKRTSVRIYETPVRDPANHRLDARINSGRQLTSHNAGDSERIHLEFIVLHGTTTLPLVPSFTKKSSGTAHRKVQALQRSRHLEM